MSNTMKRFVEDDLELPAVKPQAATTQPVAAVTATQPAAQAQPVPASSASAISDVDPDADFDAASVSTFLQKLKVQPNTVARFSVLGTVCEAWRHYDEKSKLYILNPTPRKGAQILAPDEFSTVLGTEPRYARAALIFTYTLANPQNGKLPSVEAAAAGTVMALVVSGPGWASIRNAVPEGLRLTDCDFKAWPRQNGVGLEFGLQSQSAAWRKTSPEAQARIMGEAERLKPQLAGRLGKQLTLLQAKALVSHARPTATEDSLADIDGI